MLTATTVEKAKAKDREYKLVDERGLYALITPTGSKLWRVRFRLWGKERQLSLGMFPDVSLKQARDRRDLIRQQVAEGIDPSDVRRQERSRHRDVFAVLAKEWQSAQPWAPATRVKNERAIKYLIAEVGNRPVSKITTALAWDVLKKISARGPEVGQTAYTMFRSIMLDALTLKLIDTNPVMGLSKKLPSRTGKRFAAITQPTEFAKLLSAIDGYTGTPVVRLALQMLALTFVRPGELRLATWADVDLEQLVWLVPASRTKMRRDHLVPLPPQALPILEAVKLTTFRPSVLVFPGLRPGRPLSDAAFNVALRSMGFDGDQHVSHGFRSSASTLLNERLKVPKHLIELQLAHTVKGVAGVYNRAEHLDERRAMMCAWANYLDELREAK